ncbi:hypothetical protein FNV43_RR19775 [Rhamnella rubrinervis]|uniref:Piwi domain-containing protein n=1 Tax=Rhamnella rubrinervis TaxID=2594499 RepID=A0A8K0GPU3_9ROSA|nr:hypothetical protein FNV43_RR19775 [Rhamnella rubrinervis]
MAKSRHNSNELLGSKAKKLLSEGEAPEVILAAFKCGYGIFHLRFTYENKEISVVEYLKNKHELTLKYPDLLAIEAGSKAGPIYLPMEIVLGQGYSMNASQVLVLDGISHIHASERRDIIKKMVVENDCEIVMEFEFLVKGKVQDEAPKMGKWNMVSKVRHLGMRELLGKESRCPQLVVKANNMGMQFYARPLHNKNYKGCMIERDLGDFNQQCKQKGKQRQMLIVILPDVQNGYYDCPKTIDLLNVVLRAKLSTIHTVVGSSIFSPNFQKGRLSNGLEYWGGYYQSVRPTQMGLSLNLDVSTMAFYEPIWVHEFLEKNMGSLPSGPLSSQHRLKVRGALMGLKISYRENLLYKVTEISEEPFNKLTRVFLYVNLSAIQAGSDAKPIYLPMEMVKKNGYSADEIVKEFGIPVREDLTTVDAQLNYFVNGMLTIEAPKMGKWNMIGKKLIDGGRVDYWGCVNFSQRNPNMHSCFCQQLVNMCNSKGMCVKSFEDIGQKGKQLEMLIVILPDLGIVTQCCRPEKALKMTAQYLENMTLKMNVKFTIHRLVVRNTVLEDAVERRIPFVTDVPTMIIGADVTHPNTGNDSSPSMAVVTKYKGLVSAQTHGEEIIQDLYKVCSSIQIGCEPPVTFVVVQKRHRMCLFHVNHANHHETDPSSNIQPGTLVDTMICHPSEFYFYLNGLAGIQGTSRPAHYQVLFDENGFSADALYARCTRSVSIVPPVYYTHSLAHRACYYISDTKVGGERAGARGPSTSSIPDSIKDVMFYC